jgi:hypothetical protein
MTDLLKTVSGMQSRRSIIGEKDFMVKKRFNPLAMSHENWVAIVYPEAKLFLKGLTVENFKQMLDDHREVRIKRNEKNAYLKRVVPEMFTLLENDRIYPLMGKELEPHYKKCRTKIKKRHKIISPVLFFQKDKYKIMELSKAQEILEERKKFKEEKLKEGKGSW